MFKETPEGQTNYCELCEVETRGIKFACLCLGECDCQKKKHTCGKELSINPYKEYISFLESIISSTATFLHFHGQPASPEDIAKGKELRSKIKEYEERK